MTGADPELKIGASVQEADRVVGSVGYRDRSRGCRTAA